MKAAVTKEIAAGERRVAIVPANVPQLAKLGLEVTIQEGAGAAAGFSDSDYSDRGATIVSDRGQLLSDADLILQVQSVDQQGEVSDRAALSSGKILVGMCDPLSHPQAMAGLAETGASVLSLELVPRITRAQSMDVLSSMATIAGYRAVLLAAVELPKMFPMMMTAAGTLTAARAFVIGAGVAGLQAIATAKRLGAVVQAYDVRPACREQVESVGGKFVELELETEAAEDKGGYAKALGEEFYRRQRELMAEVVSNSDLVITTAAIPGKPSPRLITADAVDGMSSGGVIVDLAAERGGNCELTEADQRIEKAGVTILGPTNLPSQVPGDASQMFSNNVTRFLANLIQDGKPALESDDEIVVGTLATHRGEVCHPRLRELLSLPPREAAGEDQEEASTDTNVDEGASAESNEA